MILHRADAKTMIQLHKILLFFLITSGVAVLPSCMFDQAPVNAPKKDGLVVINVLKKELYDDCHIEGSVSVPFDQVEKYVQTYVDKNAEIVVYCSNYMCTASGAVCKKLQDLGFSNVCAYEAGTAEWYQQGLPTQGPAKSAYLSHKLEKPTHDNDTGICIITTQELAQKIKLEKKIE